mmetsp:Transcript_34734/g.78435  ORF Transcript_34734/g.78435 Transcript_34734/m.78435 type:complete len:272 (-) Transcript_34734:256-1071(-)
MQAQDASAERFLVPGRRVRRQHVLHHRRHTGATGGCRQQHLRPARERRALRGEVRAGDREVSPCHCASSDLVEPLLALRRRPGGVYLPASGLPRDVLVDLVQRHRLAGRQLLVSRQLVEEEAAHDEHPRPAACPGSLGVQRGWERRVLRPRASLRAAASAQEQHVHGGGRDRGPAAGRGQVSPRAPWDGEEGRKPAEGEVRAAAQGRFHRSGCRARKGGGAQRTGPSSCCAAGDAEDGVESVGVPGRSEPVQGDLGASQVGSKPGHTGALQ